MRIFLKYVYHGTVLIIALAWLLTSGLTEIEEAIGRLVGAKEEELSIEEARKAGILPAKVEKAQKNEGQEDVYIPTPEVYRQRTAEEIEAELKQIEIIQPYNYIKVNGTVRPGLGFQKVVARGWLDSSSKFAIYKDISIQVDFFSYTGTLVGSSSAIIYKELKAGDSVSFSGLRLDSPLPWAKLGSVKFRVVGAVGQ